jgi:hypothetical protein
VKFVGRRKASLGAKNEDLDKTVQARHGQANSRRAFSPSKFQRSSAKAPHVSHTIMFKYKFKGKNAIFFRVNAVFLAINSPFEAASFLSYSRGIRYTEYRMVLWPALTLTLSLRRGKSKARFCVCACVSGKDHRTWHQDRGGRYSLSLEEGRDEDDSSLPKGLWSLRAPGRPWAE